MRKEKRRVVSMLTALAMAISGFTVIPAAASAADEPDESIIALSDSDIMENQEPVNIEAAAEEIDAAAESSDNIIYQKDAEMKVNLTGENTDGKLRISYQSMGYTGKVYPGATVEFDVELVEDVAFESINFKIQKRSVDWEKGLSNVTLQSSDFTDRKAHVVYTYGGSTFESLNSVQIIPNATDYRGQIKTTNFVITNATLPGPSDEVIYQNEAEQSMNMQVDDWSTFVFYDPIGFSGVVRPGTTAEFDVELVSDTSFDTINFALQKSWENWEESGSNIKLSSSDFTDKKAHATYTYIGTPFSGLDSFQIKPFSTDYRGEIKITNLIIRNGTGSDVVPTPVPGGQVLYQREKPIGPGNVTGSSWATVEGKTGGEHPKAPKGAIIEYDIEVDNDNFTNMYWEFSLTGELVAQESVSKSDFEGNVCHVKSLYCGESGTLKIFTFKFGGDTNDYTGTVSINNLVVKSGDGGDVPAPPIQSQQPQPSGDEIVITTPNQTLAKDEYVQPVDIKGILDPSQIGSGGKFVVEYSAAEETTVALILSDGTGAGANNWIGVKPTKTTAITGGYHSEYSYDDCIAAGWSGSINTLAMVGAQNWGVWDASLNGSRDVPATVTKVSYIPAGGTKPQPSGDEIVITTPNQTLAKDEYVQPVEIKGILDTSKIVSGGKFVIEYNAAEEATVALILSDGTGAGANNWIGVKPTKTTAITGGYHSEYSYDDCIAAGWSGSINTLAMVGAQNWGIWDSSLNASRDVPATITKVSYIPVGGGSNPQPGGETVVITTPNQKLAKDGYVPLVEIKGILDPAKVVSGGKFVVEYSAEEQATVGFVLSDGGSGSNSWVSVTPTTTTTTADGYRSEYSYDDCIAAGWSGSMNTLATVSAQNWGIWDESISGSRDVPVTITKISYVPAGGSVDPGPDEPDLPLGDVIYTNAEKQTVDVTADLINSWDKIGYYEVNYTKPVYPGATFEFDVTAANTPASIDINLRSEWSSNLTTETLTASDFDAATKTAHVKYVLKDKTLSGLPCFILTGAGAGDYRGNLTVSNVKITNGAVPETTYPLDADKAIYNTEVSFPNTGDTSYTYQWYKAAKPNANGKAINGATNQTFVPTASEVGGYIYCIRKSDTASERSETVPVFASNELQRTELFSGSEVLEGWENSSSHNFGAQCKTIANGGVLNADVIRPHSYVKVTFSGDTNDIGFILSSWTDSSKGWMQATPKEVIEENGNKAAIFDYDTLVNAFGSDFSVLDSVFVSNAGAAGTSITVTKAELFSYPTSVGGVGTPISYSSSHSTTGMLGYLFTEHVGGDFPTSRMKADDYFYVEYKGAKSGINAVELAFASVSGAKGGQTTYAVIKPSESGETGDGYYGKYKVSDIVKLFGTNLARIDQINISAASGKVVENVTLYYSEGTGAIVDTEDGNKPANEVEWLNKQKTGIAVIGDSITHNPLVTDAALRDTYAAKGDWTAILGRNDVTNYGIGGQTSEHIADRFDQLLLKDKGYDYDTFIMWFGINDTGLVSNDAEHAARVTGNYRTMLDKIKALNANGDNKKVYVLSILPTTSAFYEGVQNRIASTNAALKAMCDEYDFATYVDLYDHFLLPEGKTDPNCTTPNEKHANGELFMDGLHPIGKGYHMVSDALKPLLGGKYCELYKGEDGKIAYKSSYTAEAEYDMYVAAYDKATGALKAVQKNTAEGSFDINAAGSTVKALFWEKGTMTPVDDASVKGGVSIAFPG